MLRLFLMLDAKVRSGNFRLPVEIIQLEVNINFDTFIISFRIFCSILCVSLYVSIINETQVTVLDGPNSGDVSLLYCPTLDSQPDS